MCASLPFQVTILVFADVLIIAGDVELLKSGCHQLNGFMPLHTAGVGKTPIGQTFGHFNDHLVGDLTWCRATDVKAVFCSLLLSLRW